MTCLFGRIQVELNSGSSISDLYVAWGPDVKYPRSLALCIRRTLDLSVKIHVKKCVLYTRNYGTQLHKELLVISQKKGRIKDFLI